MTWLKRNWVDALMAVLIAAVFGGVLALLFRGGFNPQAATPPSAPTPANSAQPVTPPAPSSPEPAVAPPSAPSASSPQATPTPAPSGAKAVQVPEIPPFAGSSDADTASASPSPAANAPRSTPASAAPTTASREPLTYTRADFLRNYRVAVATFSSATRAQATANRLSVAGYPAQAFSTSGAAYIVVVGPYAREGSARGAYNKLRAQGYADAVLYTPSGDRERAVVASAPPAPKPSAPIGDAGSSPMQLDQGLSYLQVGAFKNTQSALPILNRLKSGGFKTLLRSARDGYIRVLVGPFNTAALQSARLNLSEQGYAPFTVRE